MGRKRNTDSFSLFAPIVFLTLSAPSTNRRVAVHGGTKDDDDKRREKRARGRRQTASFSAAVPFLHQHDQQDRGRRDDEDQETDRDRDKKRKRKKTTPEKRGEQASDVCQCWFVRSHRHNQQTNQESSCSSVPGHIPSCFFSGKVLVFIIMIAFFSLFRYLHFLVILLLCNMIIIFSPVSFQGTYFGVLHRPRDRHYHHHHHQELLRQTMRPMTMTKQRNRGQCLLPPSFGQIKKN